MNQNHSQQRFEFGLPPTMDMSLQQTLHNRHQQKQQQQFLGNYINGNGCGGTPAAGQPQPRKAFNTVHTNGIRPHSLALDPTLFQQQQSDDDDLYSVLSEKC